MRPASLAAMTSAAALITVADGSWAQSSGGFSLNQIEPTPAGDPFFSVPSPATPGHLSPRVHALLDYSHRPIRLSSGDVAVVEAQALLRLSASIAIGERLALSADLPLAIAQGSEDPGLAGVQFAELTAPELADLRFGARFRLIGEDAGPFQLGLEGYMFAPTGSPEQYTSDGEVRGALHANLGGRLDAGVGLLWGASLGAELGGANSPSLFRFGAGAAALLAGDLLQLGPEIHGSAPLGGEITLSSTPPLTSEAGATVELLLGAKLRVLGGLTFGAAAGPGLTKAVGTPTVRAVGLIGWAPLPAPRREEQAVAVVGDQDDDGVRDDIDACPDTKGQPSPDPAKDGCPPPDRDNDTVMDVDDACPNAPGAQSADPTKNGCPADSDDDGVHDAVDACPTATGVTSKDPRKNGCPSDRDDDGIIDAADACPDVRGATSADPKRSGCPDDPDGDGIKASADACPNERGLADRDPKQNGCPRFVRLREDEIVTSKPIQFRLYGKTRRETVDPVSDDLLSEVRNVILQNPDIALVEVQGHTDDNGTDEYNLELSQKRADAVLEWLVAAGVPKDKLVAKGYGFEHPIADNRIKTGRQKNRRVQFVIVKRKR